MPWSNPTVTITSDSGPKATVTLTWTDPPGATDFPASAPFVYAESEVKLRDFTTKRDGKPIEWRELIRRANDARDQARKSKQITTRALADLTAALGV